MKSSRSLRSTSALLPRRLARTSLGQCIAALLLAASSVAAAAAQGSTARVSLREGGQQGNGRSLAPSISADGRRTAFMSLASDLVSNDTNAIWDVFVRDRNTREVWRASVDSSGQGGNATSQHPALSADGLVLAFQSFATNLVPGDTNGDSDIFVHELASGLTTRVSVGPGGAQASNSSGAAAISGDGRYVAFESLATNLVAGDTNGTTDVFVHDLLTGATTRASVATGGTQANDWSGSCSISADGRYVAFSCDASNLAPGDTNGTTDIFLHDRQSGQTELVSVDSAGGPSNGPSYAPRISADGLRLSFASLASDLVPGDTNGAMDVFLRDRQNATNLRVSRSSGGTQGNAASGEGALCEAGTHVAFSSLASNLVPMDQVPADDVFVHALAGGVVSLESVCGLESEVGQDSLRTDVSADGRFVVFDSSSPDFVADDSNGEWDVFVRDRRRMRTERISLNSFGHEANGSSSHGHVSADGRHVAFDSLATNLVPGDGLLLWDVFVRDRWSGTTERVNVGAGGAAANDHSFVWDISADGRWVVFSSHGTNLVAGDTNGREDCFVHDRQTGVTTRVSLSSGGAQGNDTSTWAALSADGRFVAFQSSSTNLVAGDTNGAPDVFVRDRQAGTTERVSVGASGAQANGASAGPCLSADGRYVAFFSLSSNLVGGDTNGVADVFVRDRQTGTTARVSVGAGGAQANGASERPTLSADGRWVSFRSFAANLVPGDTNAIADVFVHDRASGETKRVSVASSGAQADGASDWPQISDDGRHVVFTSEATALVPSDANGVEDAFAHDRTPLAPTAYCFGDGGGTPCPCGNAGDFGRGCGNGTHPGGSRLHAEGEARVSADSLVLRASDSVPGQPGLFLQGNQAILGGDGIAFGDGLRCAGGSVRRLQVVGANGSGEASSSVSISIAGGVAPGDLRRYQWWYRDPVLSPCLAGFNLSNGLELVWQP